MVQMRERSLWDQLVGCVWMIAGLLVVFILACGLIAGVVYLFTGSNIAAVVRDRRPVQTFGAGDVVDLNSGDSATDANLQNGLHVQIGAFQGKDGAVMLNVLIEATEPVPSFTLTVDGSQATATLVSGSCRDHAFHSLLSGAKSCDYTLSQQPTNSFTVQNPDWVISNGATVDLNFEYVGNGTWNNQP